MRIRVPKMMRFHADPDSDPKHCICTVGTSVENLELFEAGPGLKS
jgi:hypothetical protein